MPGVEAVYTCADIEAAGVRPLGFLAIVPAVDGGPMSAPPRHAPARDRVRYVGEPVALVVARSRHQALDAAEAIEVDYSPLDSVSGVERAAAEPRNVVGLYEYGDRAALDEAMKAAAHVVSLRIVNNRIAPSAMEPRACVAEPDTATGRLTLHASSQTPHMTRKLLAAALALPEAAVRLLVRDIGGGFGSKTALYPEDVLAAFAARALGRPVAWFADRSEAFLSDAHGRDHVSVCDLALDAGVLAPALN